MTDGTTPQLPFGTALVEAIKGIRDQLLLYVLAGAIIVAAAAAGGLSFVWPLVGLLVAGLVAWTLLQATRVRAGKNTILQSFRLRPFGKSEGDVEWGDVHTGAGGGQIDQSVSVGAGGRHKGDIKHGDVDTRDR